MRRWRQKSIELRTDTEVDVNDGGDNAVKHTAWKGLKKARTKSGSDDVDQPQITTESNLAYFHHFRTLITFGPSDNAFTNSR